MGGDGPDDGPIEVAGYRVAPHVRLGPAGAAWVATIGAVAPGADATGSPLTLADVAGWRPRPRGYGATPGEARADLAAALAAEAARELARRGPR